LLTTRIPENLNIAPNIINDVRELETWMLKLLSAPVPVPGKTKVEVYEKLTIFVNQHIDLS